MGADSGGLVGPAGPAEGWLLPSKAHGPWYFLKLKLPAQVVMCPGAQGDWDVATQTPVQTSAAPAKGGGQRNRDTFSAAGKHSNDWAAFDMGRGGGGGGDGHSSQS